MWNELVRSRARSLAYGVVFVVGLAGTAHAVPSNVVAWSLSDDGSAGSTVGTAGDFNCDGIADLLIGDETSSTTPGTGPGAIVTRAGWVGIWFGGSALPTTSEPPDWFVSGTGEPFSFQDDAKLGAASAAGDVNRDGCDDVIVASRQGLGAGANVRVYFGAGGGPSTSHGWRRFIGSSGGEVESIASGDVNGDGTADILVGIPEANFGQVREGAVLVWLGSQFITSVPDGTLGEDWRAESNQVDGALGASVSAAGDVNADGRDDILAGAPGWNGTFPGTTAEGRAFLWFGSPVLASAADGNPTNRAWSMEIGVGGAHLGASVAILGDVDGDGFADLAAGAPDYDNPFVAGVGEGTVVVTRGAASPASDVFDWFHPGQVAGGLLGTAVASAGDVNGDGLADYLTGEPGVDVVAGSRGRANLLLGRPTASWGLNPASDVVYSGTFTSSGSGPNSRRFGSRLGTAGDFNGDGHSDPIVGAPATSNVFLFLGRGDTVSATSNAVVRGGQTGAVLGLGVAFAGDVNHDGFSDVVTGAPQWELGAGQTDEGRIFISYGGTCGIDCPPFFELLVPGDREGNQAGANLGWSVSGAGDVNGDGYADVIAGAPLYDASTFPCPIGQTCIAVDAGQMQVFLGSAGGLARTPAWTSSGNTRAGSKYGYTVASAGDVNGDGYGDVIVGAPYEDVISADAGRVFLYLGSAAGLSPTPSWAKNGSSANARFGIDVAGAGDVNGDGYSDVLIGADGQGSNGAVYLYLGRPTNPTFPQGLSNTPIQTFVGLQVSSAFGLTVSAAGDVNRDGFADFAVGAPEFDDDPDFGPQLGMVSVYHGAAGVPSATPATNLFGEFPDFSQNRFGNGVAGAGDVDGDGFDDLIVGDQWNSSGGVGFAQGEAYVYHGGPTGINPTIRRTLQDCTHDFCDYGRDVAGGGDVNGDGFADVLVAAYGDDGNLVDEGSVFVHHGNENRGAPVQPLQALGFGGAPRALLGATNDVFDASMKLRNPGGRGRVELELEVKPIGTNFDGAGVLKSGMLDNFTNARTALTKQGTPGVVYAWRARLRSLSPIFGRSRWISLPENAAREMDVRVVPEPTAFASLAAGLAGIAALAQRRRRQPGAPEREPRRRSRVWADEAPRSRP